MFRNSSVRRLLHTRFILASKRQIGSVSIGSKFTANYKQYLKLSNGELGSYFHDIQLDLNDKERTINMITEVSRWSNGKFEISKELEFNPIVQDVKNGKVRFVHNLFPYHGYIHNYGAIPQTWEDSTANSTILGTEMLKGDNDPLDCCEIGSKLLNTGELSKVKVIGSLALIDDGELDWKVIVINTEDPMASKVNDLNDVNTFFPGLLEATREWFRNYKIPAGKPPNSFAFDGDYKNTEETMEIIRKCHESWKKLVSGSLHKEFNKLPEIKRAGSGVTMQNSVGSPVTIPEEVNKWHYI